MFQALETLGRFETMTARLEGESKLLAAARDALSLDPTERDVLGPMQAEITDLREVSSARQMPGRAVFLLRRRRASA